ncbi:UNVERIFIED_CONTAM: hypothetical protein Sradi_2922100 [Sesamum radiatum]|uniref:Uncharacterized protein n=1 Tax=Sesamum radiatum TaxID=300843 RepID=A0AAW2S0Z3_SESRA
MQTRFEAYDDGPSIVALGMWQQNGSSATKMACHLKDRPLDKKTTTTGDTPPPRGPLFQMMQEDLLALIKEAHVKVVTQFIVELIENRPKI